MKASLLSLIIALSIAATTLTCAQQAPSAYVYLGPDRQVTTKNVPVYSVNSQGVLTHLQDAAAPDYLRKVVSTSNFLYATTGGYDTGYNIQAFRRGTDGKLTYLSATDTRPFADEVCDIGSLTLDHTGTSLYAVASVGDLCEDTTLFSFAINKTTGALTFLGDAESPYLYFQNFSFGGNNQFAFGASCGGSRGGITTSLPIYKRLTSGDLQFISGYTTPPPIDNTQAYCPAAAATDPANHVAIALEDYSYADNTTRIDPLRLATYTADAAGTLTTTSTVSNMASSAVGGVGGLAMSPTGKLLAAAGENGLQLFHFNGAAPLTQYSNLLTSDSINDAAWDKANHLYALSLAASRLHVYTVTSASITEAPGSPFTVAPSASLDVLTQGSQLADVTPPTCSTSSGAKICSPTINASTPSPAFVSAAATASTGYITAIRIYVDSVAQALVPSTTKGKALSITQALAIPHGKHTLTVVGYQSNGAAVTAKQVINIP